MNKETYVVGEEVLGFDGIWMYYANITKVIPKGNTTTYRLHYIGWEKKYDATVGPDQMMKINEEVKAIKHQIEFEADESFNPGLATEKSSYQLPKSFAMNEDVRVYHSSYFYAAKICGIRESENQYKITYNGWRKEYDEWMEVKWIFKTTPVIEQIKTNLKKYSKKKPPRRVSKRKSSLTTEKLELHAKDEQIAVNIQNDVAEQYNSHSLVETKKDNSAEVMFDSKNDINRINKNFDKDLPVIDRFDSKRGMKKRIATQEKIIKEQKATIEELKSMIDTHFCYKCYKVIGVSSKKKKEIAKKNVVKEFVFKKPTSKCVQSMQQ